MATNQTITDIRRKYWRVNLIVMSSLLFLWAISGLGGGILFADFLNDFTIPGTGLPLGFWIAQQGSIIAFVGIILVYCIVMNFLDQRYNSNLASAHNSSDR